MNLVGDEGFDRGESGAFVTVIGKKVAPVVSKTITY